MRHTDDVTLTLKLVSNVARVVEYRPANFGDTTTKPSMHLVRSHCYVPNNP